MKMPRYIKRIWKTKGAYIKALACILVLVAVTARSVTPAGMGIGAAVVVAVLLYLGPIVVVDSKNLKVKNPKPKYVETGTRWILLWYVTAMLLSAALVLTAVIVIGAGDYIAREADKDSFIAGLIIMFTILTILLLPVTAYMLYIKLAYKRVVEYRSAEWRRIHS